MTELSTVLAQQAPEDVGKAGPLGLLLIVVLLIAVFLLVRSMSTHIKRIPVSFDPDERGPEIPDTPEELFAPKPGQQVLDELRRAPLAIEPPREGQDRPDGPAARG
ncbi:hypothetical protein [Blastococcus tunisiensis]|uniref:Uncharacterized protein n=1 Tax=Blastococcus tunisiensis TaxID=1798228 RepID=A0A1I1YJC5_9ACTN|nr:hypothetical protein [Blastococcus sp. DSM 46838]SFE19656.1 hypothetical protein SAMN05216574_102382 [Blastococcus sp. DSM 46838]